MFWRYANVINRELKQQRRRRLGKRLLKSEVAPLQTLSHLFYLIPFVKTWQFFLELNSNQQYRSSEKEEESCCLVLTSSTKREFLWILFRFKKRKENSSSYVHVVHKMSNWIRSFDVVVEQWTSKKWTKKSDARAELLFWSLNLLFLEIVVVVVVVVAWVP